MFTIAIQCIHFEKRLSFMLASLRDQTYKDILVDVAYMTDETENVLKQYEGSLNVHWRRYVDKHTFQHRGLVRNDQLKYCPGNWILFSDCDMVYHPTFFENLKEEVLLNHSTANYMLISGRMSNPKEQTNALVNAQDYSEQIKEPFLLADRLPKIRKSSVGAGFFQLVNLQYSSHGGYYVEPNKCKDWAMLDKACLPKSDIQFRRRIGKKVRLPEWFTENQIHLNHNRDPDVGKHLTEQR